MPVYVDPNPEWMQWIAPERFADSDLYRIVTFFVFHSPCNRLSAMSKSLNEYGWTDPWAKPFYLNKQLTQATTSASNSFVFSAKYYDKLESVLCKAECKDNFPSKLNWERVCIYDNKRNQFLSVFYHLRNAFAHCRLNMVDYEGECVFILEDVASKMKNGRYKLSARMILRKSTLLKWIDLIEGGEKITKIKNQSKKKKRRIKYEKEQIIYNTFSNSSRYFTMCL